MGFCWDCGRVVSTPESHHVKCKRYAAPAVAQPVAQPPQEDPPRSYQEGVRICFTMFLVLLLAAGAGMVIPGALLSPQCGFDPNCWRFVSSTPSVVLLVMGSLCLAAGAILAIVWLSLYGCCGKRWICQCCRSNRAVAAPTTTAVIV